jgi:hypothetical protein
VAAVGAVDEHAKITLDGLVKDTAGSSRVLAETSTASPSDEPST